LVYEVKEKTMVIEIGSKMLYAVELVLVTVVILSIIDTFKGIR